MTDKGLNRQIVMQISQQKNEPGWMLDFRLKALEIFERLPMPAWGADLSDLDPRDIYYYVKPIEGQHNSWDQVPDNIKTTFEKLGIPQAEQKFLAGVGAQYESEVVYKRLQQRWMGSGRYFYDISTASKIILRWLKNILRRLFRLMIISLPHLIQRCGVAVALCMSLRVFILICHCRHIFALMRQVWGNLSGR